MKKVSQFEEPEHSPGFLLWQASSIWRRLIETVLTEQGLTHPQFVLLASLAWLNHKQLFVTQIELARYCKTDANMTSQVLRTLEKKGYIKREQHVDNERSKFPKITTNGLKIIEEAIPHVEQVDKRFFEKLGSDTKHCVEMLQKLSVEVELRK